MGRRPQPSTRRGLLRAAAVVIVLTAILIGIIFLVSSLTAPSAKAPTIQPSVTVPTPPASPGKGHATPAPTRTPQPHLGSTAPAKPTAKPAATATHAAKKDVALIRAPTRRAPPIG